MLWRAAAASMKYLTEKARKISLKFSQKLTGKSEETPRWRTCVGATKGSLANAVGALYVRHYFQEDAKKSALEMVHDIRAEFNTILQNVRILLILFCFDWARTRDKTVKARAMFCFEFC